MDPVLFAVSVCALGAAAVRWASSLTQSAGARVLAAVSAAAALAVAESLLLGLIGQGTSRWTLTAAAVVTWLLTLVVFTPADHPLRVQIAERWTSYGPLARAATGATSVFGLGVIAFQWWRPTYGGDALIYHAAEPALWLHTGHPGSLHQTFADYPTQAYPKTMEVLVGWAYSIARTPLAAVPITVGLTALAVAATVLALRRRGVGAAVSVLAVAAGLLLPITFKETSGIFTDLPSLAWLATSVALSSMSREEPGAAGFAAIAGGLAIGTKPTTAPFVLVGLGYAAWINRDWIRSHLLAVAVPAALALGLGGVWYVVDWHVYGSPVWPFSRFPSGRPVPVIWREYGARFLEHPAAAAKALGWQGAFKVLGGGLIVLAAVPFVAVAGFFRSGRALRRTALVGSALIVLELLLWGESQFTGLPHGNVGVVLTGLRYLLAAPLAAAVLLGLVTRAGGWISRVAVAVLLGALAEDLWQIRTATYSFPYRPDLPRTVGLLLIGAVGGLLISRSATAMRALFSRGAAAGAVIAGGLVMIVPASSYLDHYLLVTQRHGFSDVSVIRYLSSQPGWVNGHAPVAAGHVVYASMAGPHFEHALSYIDDAESCSSIRAAATAGWVILQPIRNQPYSELDYLRAPACMDGIAPVATLPGRIKIYAPPSLVATH